MLFTAEHRQKVEANVDGIADLLTKAKLDEIQLPVILKGDENHVYDLEPLIDYFVFQMRESGTVKHPALDGIELSISDIEALTGDGIDEANEQRVKAILEDFEADAKAFLSRKEGIARFTEAQVDEAAIKADAPGDEWKQRVIALDDKDLESFLEHVHKTYEANHRAGDQKAFLKNVIEGHNNKAEASVILDKIEQLLECNAKLNIISDFNHDLKIRMYILNPDEAEVIRIQKREIAAQMLIASLYSQDDAAKE